MPETVLGSGVYKQREMSSLIMWISQISREEGRRRRNKHKKGKITAGGYKCCDGSVM